MALENGIVPTMDYGRNNCGDGMNSGAWIFGLIVLAALFNGGFGGWGGNRGLGIGADEMSNSLQTNILEASANQRENCSQFTATNANITNGFANLSRDLCSQSFGIVQTITSGNSDIKDRLAAMAAADAECCCRIERELLENRYLGAQNTAAVNANTTAQVQKVLDVLCQDKLSAQAARIQQLELNQALCGVIRYPNSMTYSAGYPFGNYGSYGNCGYACGGAY